MVILAALALLVHIPVKIAPSPPPEADEGPQPTAGPLAGLCVCVDPGHGGYDGGAYGRQTGTAEKELTAYIANFARCGDPNGEGLPRWERAGHGLRTRVLRIGEKKTAMGRAAYGKMTRNFLQRKEPEA